MSDEQAITVPTPSALAPGLSEDQVDALLQMDISRLTMAQRSQYLWWFAKRQGLDPTTKPFDMLSLQGKLVLYATRTATDQLRKLHGVSIEITERGCMMIGDQPVSDVWIVKARATDSTGRTDEAVGAIGIKGFTGDALANALMKCETKAKRRVTLSICGLGIMDEIEAQSLPNVSYSSQEGPRRIEPGPSVQATEATVVESEVPASAPKKFPPAAPPIKIPKA